MSEKLNKKNILGIEITDENQEKILEYIITSLQKGEKKYYIVTPNPEIIVYADTHPEFKKIVNEAKIALPDGWGVVWASKILKNPIKTRITGTDILYKLCQRVAKRPVIVGFLGGRGGVAEATAECLQKKYPRLRVAYIAQDWDEIEFRKVDILFVAFGFPKQEEWIAQNLNKLPVKVMMGVGGAFDYVSGKVPRAPKLVRDIGFEWLFRLVVQPWRAKRQLALIKFVYLILKEKIK